MGDCDAAPVCHKRAERSSDRASRARLARSASSVRPLRRSCFTMQLTLVISGLLDLPAPALAAIDARAPALTRLLAAAGSPSVVDDGGVAVVCTALGIAKQRDWPVAASLARARASIPPRPTGCVRSRRRSRSGAATCVWRAWSATCKQRSRRRCWRRSTRTSRRTMYASTQQTRPLAGRLRYRPNAHHAAAGTRHRKAAARPPTRRRRRRAVAQLAERNPDAAVRASGQQRTRSRRARSRQQRLVLGWRRTRPGRAHARIAASMPTPGCRANSLALPPFRA